MKNILKIILVTATMSMALNVSPVYAGKQPLMEKALRNLERAERALKRAAWNKGGHRVKAIIHVKKAIEEVKMGIAVGAK